MRAQKKTSLCKKRKEKKTKTNKQYVEALFLYGLCFLIKVWAHQKKRIVQ